MFDTFACWGQRLWIEHSRISENGTESFNCSPVPILLSLFLLTTTTMSSWFQMLRLRKVENVIHCWSVSIIKLRQRDGFCSSRFRPHWPRHRRRVFRHCLLHQVTTVPRVKIDLQIGLSQASGLSGELFWSRIISQNAYVKIFRRLPAKSNTLKWIFI